MEGSSGRVMTSNCEELTGKTSERIMHLRLMDSCITQLKAQGPGAGLRMTSNCDSSTGWTSVRIIPKSYSRLNSRLESNKEEEEGLRAPRIATR